MDVENPLASLGELTKPATVLIKKISKGVGRVFEPYQLVRMAKAEAAAELIRAENRIKVGDLEHRALHRFIEEEAKKQLNMEEITRKALPLLKDEARPESVADDWITNFFDKCRIVSDVDMQRLWSEVLAGEANAPGTFSKRTVNLLSDMDRGDADLFTRLCCFNFVIAKDPIPMVYDCDKEIYTHLGINFNTLGHLESLGLIRFDNLIEFRTIRLPRSINVSYYGKTVVLTFHNESDNQLVVGRVLLTRAGEELSRVCGSKPVEGFFDFVYQRWAKQNLVPKRDEETAKAHDEANAAA